MCHDGETGKDKQEYKVTCVAQEKKGGASFCKERCNDPWKWKNIEKCPLRD